MEKLAHVHAAATSSAHREKLADVNPVLWVLRHYKSRASVSYTYLTSESSSISDTCCSENALSMRSACASLLICTHLVKAGAGSGGACYIFLHQSDNSKTILMCGTHASASGVTQLLETRTLLYHAIISSSTSEVPSSC